VLLKSHSKKQNEYETRILQTFELDSNVRVHRENRLWSKIKPQNKLPWYGADMQVALSRILKY
jgi:hypothetical protein